MTQPQRSKKQHQRRPPPPDSSSRRRSQQLESRLRRRLEAAGETERIRRRLHADLAECGWRDAMVERAKEVVRRRGLVNLTLEELASEIYDVGRATVPVEVKGRTVRDLRAALRNDDESAHR
eukprot:CAMPEP_0172533196 /NCGR_PEP_ID=MMETSP1067-20121228/5988_1 /TAXON_ID=265564 ORGANISM="Thalassiosira punctigera, Strain Tpunct2005C2" /NCGR_SAMPLE_ID=MMETSP1067 /ASSEMBLY_ACC=CAM_ASM_000444 /LENGTH=121 /DNA_ID=CAMNT_0013317811 /DNA_START=18 /DNA_END=383 /DNA_ORIENTATION=-